MLMDAADDDDDAQGAITNQSPCARHPEQLTAPPRYMPPGLTG